MSSKVKLEPVSSASYIILTAIMNFMVLYSALIDTKSLNSNYQSAWHTPYAIILRPDIPPYLTLYSAVTSAFYAVSTSDEPEPSLYMAFMKQRVAAYLSG